MIRKVLHYEVSNLERVDQHDDSYTICWDNGTCCGLDKKFGIIPKVGQTVEIFGDFGSTIRGICIDGKTAFFKGDVQIEIERQQWLEKNRKEKEAAFEKSRQKLDEDYACLPEVFKKRIDRFRKNNSNFRVDYEAYEMSCCVDAVKIANAMKTSDAVKKFENWSWDKQRKAVPNLFEGHSGNSFGCAVMLAYLYLKEPQKVYQAHGSLSPLVGSDEFGDIEKPKEQRHD